MTAALESATIPMHPVVSRRSTIIGSLALLALVAVLLESTIDVIPDQALLWVITPLRVVLVAGLVALLSGGVWPIRCTTLLDPAIVLLLLAGVASTLLAGDWSGWRGLLTSVAAFYLAVGVRKALPDAWPALALLALAGTAIASLTAVRQAANGIDTGFCRGALDASADTCTGGAMIRVIGTFYNPNLLAAFLVLLLPVAAAGSLALADRSARLIGAALVVVGYGAVVLTYSRGGIIAALAGLAVLVATRGQGIVGLPGRRRQRLATSLLVVGAIGAVAACVLALGTAGGFGVRSDVWGAALRLVTTHPLGVGLGRGGALLDAAIPGDEPFQHAHNLWLNWAVETGLPGLLAVLAMTVGVVLIVVRGVRAGSAAAATCGAGLAGFAVLSLADHPANAQRIALVLWIVLGLVAADSPPVWRLLTRRRTGGGRPAGPVPQPGPLTRPARFPG